MDFTDNQALLNAILGTGISKAPSTLGTGVLDTQQQQQQFGGQLPGQANPLEQNPGYGATMQRFFAGPQSTFGQQFPQSKHRSPVSSSGMSSMMNYNPMQAFNWSN